jgi:enterochelin esterase-like enzyme
MPRPALASVLASAIVASIGAVPAALADTQSISLFSPSNGRNISFVVYTPPGYATSGARYPMVLDLHGMGGNAANRASVQVIPTLDAAIRAGTARPMIYVFGDGQSDKFYGDAFDGHARVYSNIIGEVLPYVDANFRTTAHRRFRAVDGFSMGGFGAMMYATKRPDLFSAAVGYAGAYQDWPWLLPTVKSTMYGDVESNFTPYSVYAQTRLNAATAAAQLKLRMLVGGDDPILTSNRNYNTYLNQQLAPHGASNIPLTVVPGIGHDGRAMYATGIGLEWLDEHFGGVTPGDADIDGQVDFDDLLVLAAGTARHRTRVGSMATSPGTGTSTSTTCWPWRATTTASRGHPWRTTGTWRRRSCRSRRSFASRCWR